MEKYVLKRNRFPKNLQEIPSPPKELYIMGELPDENKIHLAVVGTRKYSDYGKNACESIISGLAKYSKNFVIVSGLAIGIDSIAHRSAIKNGLQTIAIPGSGLDNSVLYPSSNKKLAEEIINSNGCLISELEWKIKAALHTFPSRNRIIAGISQATLVIEAPEKSGALITSEYAVEFNRDVFAVPGHIFSENSKGTNKLIKRGAFPVTCAEDILEALDINFEPKNLQFDFTPIEQKIIEALSEPISKDELIRALKIPANEINPALAIMEIKGIIKQSNGTIFKNY